ncbi:hypothetical protein DFH09DRAFT_1098052 [Mycena vulgaris]|nr:hypothetical protein DFH09DRAFT_1098052 [Mycena vulgaris]
MGIPCRHCFRTWINVQGLPFHISLIRPRRYQDPAFATESIPAVCRTHELKSQEFKFETSTIQSGINTRRREVINSLADSRVNEDNLDSGPNPKKSCSRGFSEKPGFLIRIIRPARVDMTGKLPDHHVEVPLNLNRLGKIEVEKRSVLLDPANGKSLATFCDVAISTGFDGRAASSSVCLDWVINSGLRTRSSQLSGLLTLPCDAGVISMYFWPAYPGPDETLAKRRAGSLPTAVQVEGKLRPPMFYEYLLNILLCPGRITPSFFVVAVIG